MEEKLSVSEQERALPSDLAGALDQALALPAKDWSQYSPLTLAWLGDAVHHLAVRMVLVKRGNRQADKLHREASSLVNARSQAKLVDDLRKTFSPEEEAIYRRGRNASPAHTAKNAQREQYLKATGLECLLGYLYLQGRYERIAELLKDYI